MVLNSPGVEIVKNWKTAKLMCGNYRYLLGVSCNEFSFIKEQYIYRMMSHAFCKGFWSKNSHIMCGKTYVKKIVFHSQKSALGRNGSVCSVKLSNRFYNCFGITSVLQASTKKEWKKYLEEKFMKSIIKLVLWSKTSWCLHRPKLHRGNNVSFGFVSLTYQGDQISNTLPSSETDFSSIW